MSHHPTLPPSSADAIRQCCRYVSGEAGEAAQRGTIQHALLAAILTNSPQDMRPELTEDEREGVEWAAAYVQAHVSSGTALNIEERVVILDETTFEEISYGTLDVWANPELMDYKSGEEHEYAGQMAFYGLGMMQRTGLERIHVSILYGKTKRVQDYWLTKAAAEKIVHEVLARRAKGGEPTPCDYCGWCADCASCAAHNATALAVVRGYETPTFEQWHPSEITDPGTLSKMLTVAKLVSKWCESVEHHAKEMVIKKGIPLPGWRVQERSGARIITDLTKAYNALALDPMVFLGCCTGKITNLEEAYAAAHKLKASEAKKKVAALLEAVVRPGDKQAFLVREKTK